MKDLETMTTAASGEGATGVQSAEQAALCQCEQCLLERAAPDMLAALIEARKQLEVYEYHRSGADFNDAQINAAIAKATGTEPANRDEPMQDTTGVVP